MAYVIRQMHPEDADRKGYVHYTSWQETYPGLVDAGYLARMSLKKCQDIAGKWSENTFVAELDGKIVGFSCYRRFDIDPLPRHGEIMALYVLKEAQGFGIGKALLEAAIAQLTNFREIHLWVLQGNQQAIGFYEHHGFRLDGIASELKLGTVNTQLRMILRQQPHLSIDFDLFFSRLSDEEYKHVINETNFYLEGDPIYDCCWLGRLEGDTPYWFGLVSDGSQAYEYASAQELVNAKVFHGSSLQDLWGQVRFYSIGSIDPDTWLARYG